jgi:uncharacterized protein
MPHGPMACPVDGTTLTMSERSGIEIDYCPTCRGVWLDRGELDKIIERSDAGPAPTAQPRMAPPQQPRGDWDDDDRRYGKSYDGRRKKSFLQELFD